MPTRLIIATTNANKLREIQALLADAPVHVIGLDALPPVPEPAEPVRHFRKTHG